MTEYISKQAFKEKYLACGWLPEMSGEEFDAFPAADVAPVRHGRWIGEPVDIDGHTAMECSECHKIRVLDEYCSSCGARMDKEADHD